MDFVALFILLHIYMSEEKKIDQFVEEVIFRPVEEEITQSYIDYAMSVIVSRALPDVRDGLKPVSMTGT